MGKLTYRLSAIAIAWIAFGCSEISRDNPFDPNGNALSTDSGSSHDGSSSSGNSSSTASQSSASGSSSATTLSSSAIASSSSQKSASSSSVTTSSSSNRIVIWDARSGKDSLGNGYEGIFSTLLDVVEGGNTTSTPSGTFDVSDRVTQCGGSSLCVSFQLGTTYTNETNESLNPWAKLNFAFTRTVDYDMSGKYLCIAYTSSTKLRLNILYNKTETDTMGYNPPGWILPLASDKSVFIKAFSTATQEDGWGNAVNPNTYIDKIRGASFLFNSSVSTEKTINVYWIGIADSESECANQ